VVSGASAMEEWMTAATGIITSQEFEAILFAT